MNGQIDQLVRSLLQKESIDQCSLQELEQFASRHPFFGAAQLLLTKKMQLENSDQYQQQLEKTYLFFHNPLWVQQLLDDAGQATVIAAEKKAGTERIDIKADQDLETGRATIEQDTFSAPATEQSGEVILEEENVPSAASDKAAVVVEKNIEEIPVVHDPPTQVEPPVAMQGPVKDDLLFEPYHTVDYFASQGIKIRDDEQPVDKFGKKLRSFTDWLKSMKRLPVTEIVAKVEPGAEQKVDQLAEHSLKEREVVTEAMAEVWEKQGNKAKAIEIYNKLSLLDPSKSPYFAAKIEHLKKLN